MPGSKIGVGRLFPMGVLSWAKRSVNSLQSCLYRKEKDKEEKREKVVVRLIPHFTKTTKVERRSRFRQKLMPRPRIGNFCHLPFPQDCSGASRGKPASPCSGCSSGERFLQLQDNTRSGDRNLSDSHKNASEALWCFKDASEAVCLVALEIIRTKNSCAMGLPTTIFLEAGQLPPVLFLEESTAMH